MYALKEEVNPFSKHIFCILYNAGSELLNIKWVRKREAFEAADGFVELSIRKYDLLQLRKESENVLA